jgi:3-deoxy-manno-octulosonate cytidylyltransferase (CMP-KDO synthetase)
MKRYYVVIPFRLKSSRFPEKILAQFKGITVIETALGIAADIGLGKIILTAPQEDYKYVKERVNLSHYEYEYIPSSPMCRAASDRVVEIYPLIPDGDVYISIPADEVLLNSEEVRYCAEKYDPRSGAIQTLYCDFYCLEDAVSKLSAKVVCNTDNRMIYMSRSIVPAAKSGMIDLSNLKKNVGVFFFCKTTLDKLHALRNKTTTLDRIEGLEQLRWVELDIPVTVEKIDHQGFGIDMPDQIVQLEERSQCLPKHAK